MKIKNFLWMTSKCCLTAMCCKEKRGYYIKYNIMFCGKLHGKFVEHIIAYS